MKYHDTINRDYSYTLSDGSVLRHYYGCTDGRPYYEATKNGKTRAIRNEHAFLATLNADIAKQMLPTFQRARTPEAIVEASQLITSTRGRTTGPEITDTYRTPDGRKYRVTYYTGTLTEWGYV